jgi:hypothetical protein
MPIVVTGLKELRAELAALPGATDAEITTALKGGAVKLAARAKQLAPKKTGKLAASGTAFATPLSAGVKFTHPGSNVQEFATDYLRQPPGKGGTAARRLKRHVAKGDVKVADSGLVPVHMVNVQPKGMSGGRFAYKARDELAPVLMESTWEGLVEILRCHGWFDG